MTIVFTAISAFAGGVFAVSLKTHEMPDSSMRWDDRVAYWEEQINARGGPVAYEVFAEAAKPLTYDRQHQWAHAFGAALFRSKGVEGIATCDHRFSFGCYHQFLGDAIAALGIESIPGLSDACFKSNVKSPLSCQHGIGHGTLTAVGYDEAAMHRALTICHDLPGTDPIGGCYGGVFMEYNMQTTLAEAGRPREYTGDPFDSCLPLEAPFLPACVYWQPQWWMQTVFENVPDEVSFDTMHTYCDRYSEDSVTLKQCFEGVGNITAYESGFDTKRARELCDIFSRQGAARLLCRSIAASHFRELSGVPTAMTMCEDLESPDREYCLQYAETTSGYRTAVLPYHL